MREDLAYDAAMSWADANAANSLDARSFAAKVVAVYRGVQAGLSPGCPAAASAFPESAPSETQAVDASPAPSTALTATEHEAVQHLLAKHEAGVLDVLCVLRAVLAGLLEQASRSTNCPPQDVLAHSETA